MINMKQKNNYVQTKQKKITDYIDDTPLLTPDDIEWQKQHQAKVKSGKKGVRGTDPAYQHMPSYPVTLSSKQADVKELVDERMKSSISKVSLTSVVTVVQKKCKLSVVN